MARVTHVKAAQQRYKTVPVIDPATGKQKVVETSRKAKGGRPVTMRVTQEDRTRPLPPETCDSCGKPIEVGTPYKWIKPKSGPYGGRKRSRHESCPTWQVWDYSDSLSANTARIQHQGGEALSAAISSGDPEEVRSALTDAASEVRELAEQKRESAESIESGFGHSTYQSEELSDLADQLESWADDMESADVPEREDHRCEAHDTEPGECDECQMIREESEDDDALCLDHQTDPVDCDECLSAWSEAVEAEVTALDECPV